MWDRAFCLGASPCFGFDMEGGVGIDGRDDLQMLHRWDS